jgi:hypothetical protein
MADDTPPDLVRAVLAEAGVAAAVVN